MSSRCRTVAPSQAVPASSGSTEVTSDSGSSSPRPARTPAVVAVIDFETDISRCVAGRGEPVPVDLGDDPAPVDHEEAVGVRGVEGLGERPRAPLGLELERRQVRSSRGSGRGLAARSMRAVGIRSRTCWNPHRLKGGSCQFARVTRPPGAGGDPSIRPSSAAVGGAAGLAQADVTARPASRAHCVRRAINSHGPRRLSS